MEKKTVKQPVRRGRAKVPVVMQMETLECGAASLAMVMAYYGKWVPLEQVRLDCGVSRDGSNAKNVLVAARSYGFEAQGFRCEVGALKKDMSYPCIIHWNFNHFVVLDGFKGDWAYLNDPARGEVKVSMEEFDRSFTGICLQITPGPDFQPGGKPKSTIAFARKRLVGAGAAVAFVMLSSVIGYLFGIINPVFSGFFMDRLLAGMLVWGAVARIDSFAPGVADVRNGEVVVIFDDAQVGKNVETGMMLTIGEGEYPITSVGYMEDGNVFALSSANLADGLYEARVVFRTTQVLRLLFN